MIIATWNIGEDDRNENSELTIDSYKEIIKMIEEQKIDVVCLDESVIKSPVLPSIKNYITEKTDLKYATELELSDSHINIGSRMGITVCSKFKLENIESYLLKNPNIKYKKSENVTYYSHDKGYIGCTINGIRIVTAFCLPFHYFKRDAKDFKYIYDELDDYVVSEYNKNKNLIFCGDLNYENIDLLFPKTLNIATNYINVPTHKEDIQDRIIISNKINPKSIKVLHNFSDHKICIAEI